MQTTLVGYTGFVGGNLARSHAFDRLYNSKNIADAFDERHGLVVYAGMRAEKFLANSDPDGDKRLVEQALDNIRRMRPDKLVLISTVDVYKNPRGVDETTPVDTDGLHPYGYNRYLLEQWAAEAVADCHIVRLPGLFGHGMKKNFIYDMMTLVPSMLKAEKYDALCAQSPLVEPSYAPAPNGFYKLRELDAAAQEKLRAFFAHNDFNSLRFTDSRAVYQFYNLVNLWRDIETMLEADVRLLNISSEPTSAAEVYEFVKGAPFVNEITPTPVVYDWRSIHAARFGGKNGYLYNKETILQEIKQGVESGALLG